MLQNKTIVVTGAASGIGAETVKVIKGQGDKVIAVDLNEPRSLSENRHFVQNREVFKKYAQPYS